MGRDHQHFFPRVDGVNVNFSGAQGRFQLLQLFRGHRLQLGHHQLLRDAQGVSRRVIVCQRSGIPLPQGFQIGGISKGTVTLRVFLQRHQRIINIVARVKIGGFPLQQQADPQLPVHVHLPDMGEAAQLVQALIRQGLPGQVAYIAPGGAVPLHHNGIGCLGRRKGIDTAVQNDGKQRRAEAHQRGQNHGPQEPGWIQPDEPF